MARKSALPYIMAREAPKHLAAAKRVGTKRGFVYRTRSTDPDFHHPGTGCSRCGQNYANPAEDSIGWTTPKRPKGIAEAWASTHDVYVVVERREAWITRNPGKNTVYTATSVEQVQPIEGTSWIVYQRFPGASTRWTTGEG